MATPTTPLSIPPAAQTRVQLYIQRALQYYVNSFNVRGQLVKRDLSYIRETDKTQTQSRAKAANDAGDSTKMQNVVLPVVMPQVESAVAYAVETFLTGYPIFGVVAPPEQQEALAQMEALLGENSTTAAWPLNLTQAFRDGYKYNLGAVEVCWEIKKTYSIGTPTNVQAGNGSVEETQYAGNYITRLDPYNLILDTRVAPAKCHIEGEYAGYTLRLSRIAVKERMANLNSASTMNFRQALETATGSNPLTGDMTAAYYVPSLNPGALIPAGQQVEFDWLAWVHNAGSNKKPEIQYQNSYDWTVLYARILPSDFEINTPARNHVQIWKFISLNGILIFAERQTNAHNYLPIIACVPIDDGLGWQSKGLAENAAPYQSIGSSLANSGLESQRRKVYDRIFYDPTRINKKDIDTVSSVARVPVKANNYGKPISEAYNVSPYRDDGVAETMQLANQMGDWADAANGYNRVQQGRFQKGNKTRSEFETTMDNSNSRQKMALQSLEFSFMVPIKMIIKSNILQYQPPVTLVNTQTKQQVKVDPTALRKAMISFSLSDGVMPSDKLISGDMFGLIFQAAPAMPELRAEYDLMGMFAYWATLRGAHWMKDFKLTPEQKQEKIALMTQATTAAGSPSAPQPGINQTGA
jgi:hypothetical protein